MCWNRRLYADYKDNGNKNFIGLILLSVLLVSVCSEYVNILVNSLLPDNTITLTVKIQLCIYLMMLMRITCFNIALRMLENQELNTETPRSLVTLGICWCAMEMMQELH